MPSTPTPPTPKSLKVSIKKTGEPAQGVPGTAVDYSFEVTNEGDEKFDAVVVDDQLGEIGQREVAPGATETFTTNVDVPSDAQGSFVNTATVTATGPGGTATAQASHEFRVVVRGEPPSINVALRAPTAVRPGSQIPYTLLVQNDGPVDVRAQVSDSLGALPAAAAELEIAVGDVKTFRYQYRPLANESTVKETVTGLATSADGQEAQDEETINTKVSGGAPAPDTDVHLRDIDGIGETREKQLIEAGIDSVQKLVEADARRIVEIVGPPATEDQVKRWQEQGKRLLNQ
jgi:predicted flap endonuclease-1-like 5' DNA nuclease